MNTVLRKHDGAMVIRWIPGFPKGKGILDAVNCGKGLEFDLKEIETTDQEYMDNWYQREPREAAEIEAKITERMDKNARDQAIAELKAEEEIPEDYQPTTSIA